MVNTLGTKMMNHMDWYRQPEKVAALEADFAQLHEMLKLNTDELAASAVLAECR